jgi:hypothetical protein
MTELLMGEEPKRVPVQPYLLDGAGVLEENLEEEKAADTKLTAIGERNVNADAA